MAYVTIPQLPAGSALTGLEQFEAVQSAVSVKLTAAQLKDYIAVSPDLVIDDTNLNGVSIAATFTHIVNGTPAVGIGVGIDFDTEISASNVVTGSSIASVSTDSTPTQEDFALSFKTMGNGVLDEKARLTGDGFFGVNTSAPSAPVDATATSTGSSVVQVGLAVTHSASAPGVGIGSAIQFRASTSLSTIKDAARISAISTSISVSAESFDLAFSLTVAGSTNQEVARLTSNKRLGIGTTTPTTTLEASLDDATVNSVLSVARITRTATSPGVPAIGIGTALEFATSTAISVTKVSGAIYTVSTGLLSSSENFDLAFSTLGTGSLTEAVRITSTKFLGINTTAPATTLHAVRSDSSTNTVLSVGRLTRLSTATPGIGIGSRLEFEVETAVGTNNVGASIDAVTTSISAGSEDFDLVFNTMSVGTATEKFRIGSIDITPSVPFSKFGAGIAPAATTRIKVATSSTTVSPIQFDTVAPTLLTAAQAGGVDYNGEALYFTPQGIERGVLPSRMVYINTAGTRAGPNAVNTAQAVTVTAGSSTLTVATAVPGSAVGNTGCLAIFSAATIPTGLVAGQPYWVNWLTATTMTVSATQGGTPITPSTTGTTVTVIFHFPILGNGTNSVGLRLGANTRYMYELYFTISHTGATATTVAYALTNQTGTLSAHYYRVISQGSTAAFTGNKAGVAATSNNVMSNYITSGFNVFDVVTGGTAATANTTNLVIVQGQIDTVTDCTYVIPTIGFPVAPTLSTIFQGAYMSIYPVGPVVSNTSVGSWET